MNLGSLGVRCTVVTCCCFFKLNSTKLVCGTSGACGCICIRSTPPFRATPAGAMCAWTATRPVVRSGWPPAALLVSLRLPDTRGLPRKLVLPGLRRVLAAQSSRCPAVVLSRSVMWRRLRRQSSWWLRNFWPSAGLVAGRAVCGLAQPSTRPPRAGRPTSSVRP